MPTPASRVTQNRINEFISMLEEMGGSAGNRALRESLDWAEDFYWNVQGKLIGEGRIVAGRGRGGSVRFTESQAEESGTDSNNAVESSEFVINRERDLYPHLKATIEKKWINRFALDQVLVEETHSQSSKITGGTFTRPDITAAGVRQYVYLEKRLEIVTFEVKTAQAVNIIGVLEAIAHREAAHRSYVIYAVSKDVFEKMSESQRIIELALKYGIGILLTEHPNLVETWDVPIDAIRHEPDPVRLDQFLIDLPSEKIKQQLLKWK